MARVEEVSLGKLLLDLRRLSPAEQQAKHGHPFLVREAEVWKEERTELSAEEKAARAEKAYRLMGNSKGYVLAMVGAKSIEQVIEQSQQKTVLRREQRVLLVRRGEGVAAPGDVVSVGTDAGCDVTLDPALGEGLAARHARFVAGPAPDSWLIMDDRSEWGTFAEGARLEPRRLVELSEADTVRLGGTLEYRFFSRRGFFAWLHYRSRLEQARARPA